MKSSDYSILSDLRQVYLLNNKNALNGKKIIDGYVNKNDVIGLAKLLRHHDEKTITENETWTRDEIDYFIEYFSVLSVGHIVGLISINELSFIEKEIVFYLGNLPIKRYYYSNYELILPQILFEVVLNNKPFSQYQYSKEIQNQFYEFHSLNQSIQNDEVNQYLWFLDGGNNDNYDLSDLKRVLKKQEKYKLILESKSSDALDYAVKGFFSFIEFIYEFDSFLSRIEDSNKAAAYWLFYQYWFKKIKTQLRSTIIQFHDGLILFSGNIQKNEMEFDKRKIRNKSNIFLSIQKSKNDYIELLNRLLFNSNYEAILTSQLKSWRSEIS